MDVVKKDIFANVIEFAMSKGILMKTSRQECTHLPLTIFPTPIPKDKFEELQQIQPHINKLMFLASQDDQFLSQSLKSVLEADEFSKHLFNVYERAKMCETKSSFDLGILRSDYMFDFNSNIEVFSPKQIEINTIAAGCVGVGGNCLKSVHIKALKESNRNNEIPLLPNNTSTVDIATCLVEGWISYGNPKAVIVFVVIEAESNVFDQRLLEYAINSLNDNILISRRTFNDVIDSAHLADDGVLFIQGEEVALIYFRSGYQPSDYSSSKHWDARLIMEKSKAIKCPSVALQLTGCKKFQEILARPGSVERFIDDSESVTAIRKTFAGLYSLEMNADGDRTVEMALSNPENYVMKPQREGGGNNIYGKDIVPLLKEIGNCDKRSAYILMDRVRPKSSKNYKAVKYEVTKCDCISELGIFGVFLAENGKIKINQAAGHLLRNKSKHLNEGGIMVGTAVLSSPMLVG